MDAAWMLKGFGKKHDILELLAERESVFQNLTKVKSSSLVKKVSGYTIDPKTRYRSLNMKVKSSEIKHLYDLSQPQQSSHISKENICSKLLIKQYIPYHLHLF